jgi:hypothetical protein
MGAPRNTNSMVGGLKPEVENNLQENLLEIVDKVHLEADLGVYYVIR